MKKINKELEESKRKYPLKNGYNKIVENDKPLYIVYINETTLKMMAYVGKQKNPVRFYRFSSIEDLNKNVQDFIINIESRHKADIERKAEEKRISKETFANLEIGTILYSSWGYDQTNIDFFQVVGKTTGQKIQFRSIYGENDDTAETGNSMACYLKPCKDSFKKESEVITKRWGRWGVKLDSYRSASIADSKNYYCSWYA